MSKAISIHLFRSGMFLVLVSFLLIPMDTVFGNLIVWKIGFYLGVLMAIAGVAFWMKSKRHGTKKHLQNPNEWAASASTNEEHERRLKTIGDFGPTQAFLGAGLIGAAALAPRAFGSSVVADFFSSFSSGGALAQDVNDSPIKIDDAFAKTYHGPMMNVDGTLMMGETGFDINGNAYGVTQDMVGGNDFMSDMSSSGMDFGSNDFGMNSDPFNS